MDTSEDNDWKRFSLTVKHNRKRKKNTKTLIFDLSHVIQPMQMQFVVTHDKQRLEEFLGKQGASLSDCSHGNITLSLESSGTVDEVGVQATNLIIHFLLEYDTIPFYLSEDEAEQKYAMKEQIGKVCLALNVNVIWKEESNIIWLIGSSTAVKKCFLSLMTFCQGTSEKAQAISQATFVDWEKCKQSAQAPVTESEGTISMEKHRQELLAVEDRHKMILEETRKKHKEELQKLTEEIQRMKKNEDELKTAFEALKSEQDKLKILAATDKDKFEAKLAVSEKENAKLKEQISQLESDKHVKIATRRNRRFVAKPIADTVQEDFSCDNKSTSTRTSSFYECTSSDQRAANFTTREGLVVRVYAGSILHLDVDCIVNAANENLQHGGGIAFVIARAAGYEFDRESRDYVNQNGSLAVGECCTTTAGDLKYKGVIHTVGPRWYDYPNDQIGCLDDLTQAVKAVMIECDYQQFTKVAIPAISSGIFGVPKDLCAQQYYRAVTEYSAQDWDRSSSLTEVHFVDKDQGMVDLIARTFSECCQKDRKMKKAMLPDLGQTVKSIGSKTFSSTRSHDTTMREKFKRSLSSDSESSGQPLQKSFTKKESENCCICMDDVTDPKKLKCGHTFCRDCIEMQFQYKPVCPSCGAVYGKIIGDQPEGTMKISTSKYGSLQGYEGCGIITISYHFPPGKQGPDHPQPGQPYEGISRGAYLPNNERGKLVSKLLKIAFDRKLVFTIGRSRTTGKEGVVTWNDIHHKTRMDGGPPRFGYPDPTYLDRVMEELEVKGVTEDSLNDP